MEILKITDLSFLYPENEKKALNNLNLQINKGEFVTLFGKSGCGKSTLLKLIHPSLAPFGTISGEINIACPNSVGLVMQNPDDGIVTDKVWHEIAFGLENIGIKNSEIRARVAETASFFGINSWFNKSINDLSGGQKQLVALASVMVLKPSLLLLDEPTSQLDPIAAGEFLSALKRVNDETGVTVILTEHRLEEAIPVSDRILYMEDGRIVAEDDEICGYLKTKGMAAALPVPMRIHTAVENDMICPRSVRDGRDWLNNIIENRDLIPVPINPCSNESDSALEMKNIWFRYGKALPDVIKGLSLNLKKGEITAVMGGNGSGKSTALSIAAGILKPVCGRVEVNGKIGFLPQNPETVFLCDTVLEDFRRFGDTNEIESVCGLCSLEDVILRAPSDISGGELQRAALADVLLTKPDILLLDEPTKGMDAEFKQDLGCILNCLKAQGKAICIVSHDVEFCAEYADICSLFFEGEIVSSAEPQLFFTNLSYYTTSACRMASGIIDNAVIPLHIITALGGCEQKRDAPKKYYKLPDCKSTSLKKKPDYVSGVLSMLLFAIISFFIKDKFSGFLNTIFMVLSIIFCGFGLTCFFPQLPFEEEGNLCKNRFGLRTILSVFVLIVSAFATVYLGSCLFSDRRYYIISMLIIFETFAVFAVSFERSKPKARDVCLVSVLCALAVAGREAFFMLHQFKPMAAVVIISGAALGSGTGFLVGAMSAFVSNFFFGQGAWTPWQMFALGLIGAISGLVFYGRRKTRLKLCVFGGVSVLVIYGLIMNPASVIMAGDSINFAVIIASLQAGLPFDIMHAASTVFFLWFGAAPIIKKLSAVRRKYGVYENVRL